MDKVTSYHHVPALGTYELDVYPLGIHAEGTQQKLRTASS
jgi:hypothetical protein